MSYLVIHWKHSDFQIKYFNGNMDEFFYNLVLANMYMEHQNSVKDLDLHLKKSGFKPEIKNRCCSDGFGRAMMKGV